MEDIIELIPFDTHVFSGGTKTIKIQSRIITKFDTHVISPGTKTSIADAPPSESFDTHDNFPGTKTDSQVFIYTDL